MLSALARWTTTRPRPDPLVGGQTAEFVDAKHAIAGRLPLAGSIIALATLLVVFLVTRSIVIPVQALVANGLSLTAMLDALVWVLQDAHLSGLLGFTPTG